MERFGRTAWQRHIKHLACFLWTCFKSVANP